MYGLESGRPDFSHKHANHRQQVEPLISLYQDGEANAEERRTVEYYLERCSYCRALLATFVQVESDLRSYVQKTPVPRINPSFFRQASLIEENPSKAKTNQAPAQILAFNNSNTPLLEGGRTNTKRPALSLLARYGGTIAACLLLLGVAGLLFLSINSLQISPTRVVSAVTPQAMFNATTTALAENKPTTTTTDSTQPVKTSTLGSTTGVTSPKSDAKTSPPTLTQTTQASSQPQVTESATRPTSATTAAVSITVHTTSPAATTTTVTSKAGPSTDPTVAPSTAVPASNTTLTTLATANTNTPIPDPTSTSQATALALPTYVTSVATANTATITNSSTNTVTANTATTDTSTLVIVATPTVNTNATPSASPNPNSTTIADDQTPSMSTTAAPRGNGQITNTTPVPTNTDSSGETSTATSPGPAVTTPMPTSTDSNPETTTSTAGPGNTLMPTTTSVSTTTVVPTVTASTTAITNASPVRANGWLAYVAVRDGEIHLVTSDGSSDHALTTNTTNINWHQLVWSPDHRWIAAVGSNKRGLSQIYLLDISSHHPDISPIVNGLAPTWSPDSLQLAYLATEVNAATVGNSSVIDLKHRIVGHLNDTLTSLAPEWFPDGQRLLMGQDNIYKVTLSNKIAGYQFTLVQHLDLDFVNTCTATALSPEGSRLAALEQDKNGLPQLVIYNLAVEGAAPTPIVTIRKADDTLTIGRNCGQRRLAWTPNGRAVYFYAQGASKYYNVLISAISGETKFLSGVLEPSFSPDGDYLADYNPTTKQVYVISANSSRPANPYPIANANFAPVWQPNI